MEGYSAPELTIRAPNHSLSMKISHWAYPARKVVCATVKECATNDFFIPSTIQYRRIGGLPAVEGVVNVDPGATTPALLGAIYIIRNSKDGFVINYQPIDSPMVGTVQEIVNSMAFLSDPH
jgi:hypothetical protein